MIGNSKLGGNQFAVWLRSGLCGQVQGWGPELGGRIPVATGRPCVINGVHECPFADTATLLKAGSEGAQREHGEEPAGRQGRDKIPSISRT